MSKPVIIFVIAFCLTNAGFAAELPAPPATPMEASVPIQAVTGGECAHWFGYYDKLQFDTGNRYILGMAVSFEDRAPTPEDAVVLGMIDTLEDNKWIPFAESTAWCWQQGCMLQWLPGSDSKVIYNARDNSGYISVIYDVFSGEKRILPRPIYAVHPDGKSAVGLNFARVGEMRPGYGYNGLPDPYANELHPENDGIYFIDLVTGESQTIITIKQIVEISTDDTMRTGKHWFNHLLFNPDGTRFVFLHRWHKESGKSWYTRGFTSSPDGSGIYCFNDHGMVSHFIWKDSAHLLAWAREPDTGNKFHLYTDRGESVEAVGEGVLTEDGHCTYSPCREWILTDTYPDRERMQTLMLYNPQKRTLVKLGKFYQAPTDDIQLRCDLHPRWSRDGRFICIDSKFSGKRQMYLLDVGSIIGKNSGQAASIGVNK